MRTSLPGAPHASAVSRHRRWRPTVISSRRFPGSSKDQESRLAFCGISAEGPSPAPPPFEGSLADGRLTVPTDPGPPRGALSLTIIESRAEELRLLGAYRTDDPESGLFAIYPRSRTRGGSPR